MKRVPLATVALTAVGGLIVFAMLGTLVDWLWQGRLVRRSIAAVYNHFPVGMGYPDALSRVRHDYPERYTDTTADTCAKDAAMTEPTYRPQGGPCIVALEETGSTWWGYESAVQLRLLFDSSERLRVIQAYAVYTFL